MAIENQSLPPLTWLRAFESAARHLSFTRAAAELNLTQSAVSQHVRSLEGFLGRDLFLRKTRALELTEDGSNYLPIVREAFAMLASGTQAFIGGDRGRTLVLQCNLAFSVFWLAPRLHRLYAAHPWIVLNVVTPIWDPERSAQSAPIEIRFGRSEEMSRSAQRLFKERFFPVCSAEYQNGEVDLSTATLLDCAGVTGSWGTWFETQNKSFEREGQVNLTSTYVIAMQAACHGAGVSMSHDTLARDLLRSGTLIRPFSHSAELAEGYYIVPPAEHSGTPATRAFQDWMQDEARRFIGESDAL